MEEKVKDAELRAKDAEKKCGELQIKLDESKSTESVIAEFWTSQEYFNKLGTKAAAKIARSWVVAEKLLKTNPKATWDLFRPLIIRAEQHFAATGEEPEPYEDLDALEFDEEEEELAPEEQSVLVENPPPGETPAQKPPPGN